MLKSIVAQYNAEQLISQREKVSGEIREVLEKRTREFNIIPLFSLARRKPNRKTHLDSTLQLLDRTENQKPCWLYNVQFVSGGHCTTGKEAVRRLV